MYVFDEPTKGVDVGAKHEIFELIGQLACEGKGIIYASSEIPEILGIADRTYVMYDQSIAKELKTTETAVTKKKLKKFINENRGKIKDRLEKDLKAKARTMSEVSVNENAKTKS